MKTKMTPEQVRKSKQDLIYIYENLGVPQESVLKVISQLKKAIVSLSAESNISIEESYASLSLMAEIDNSDVLLKIPAFRESIKAILLMSFMELTFCDSNKN